MRITTLQAGEASLHRQLRLAALQDSPQSFGQRYDEAVKLPTSYWEGLTRKVTPPSWQTMVLACRDQVYLGSAYGLGDGQRQRVGHVGGMWVDPSCRGQGVGGALLARILQWAKEGSLSRLELWAPLHEAGALALYRRGGFSPTGRRRPFPADAALEIVEMGLDLADVA